MALQLADGPVRVAADRLIGDLLVGRLHDQRHRQRLVHRGAASEQRRIARSIGDSSMEVGPAVSALLAHNTVTFSPPFAPVCPRPAPLSVFIIRPSWPFGGLNLKCVFNLRSYLINVLSMFSDHDFVLI